jgi:ATP-binding cassette subfamily B protein
MLPALVRAFLPETLQHRRLIAASYACRALAVAAMVVSPWPLKVIIDRAVLGHGQSVVPGIGPVTPGQLVVLLTVGFFALIAISAVAGAAEKNISATVREHLTLDLRDRLLGHLLTLSPALRTKHRSGELVLRIVDDTDLFVRVVTKTLPQVFQHVLTIAGTLMMMLWVAPLVALVGVVWLPFVALVIRTDGRRLWRASREKRAREGEVCGLTQEIVRGMLVVQASGTQQATRDAYRQLNATRVRAGREETAAAVSLERTLQILQGIALGLVTGVGAWMVLRGRISVGDLTLLSVYVGQLLKPIEKLNDLAETTGRGLAGGERLLRMLEQAPSVADAPEAIAIARARGDLDLAGVSFTYPERQRAVLTHLDLHLSPGTLTVLVGTSGAGKSTLLSLLVRLADPDAGEIRLDGRPIKTIRLQSLREQFAFLSQDTHLFAGSIRQAVTPVRAERIDDKELWEALALVSLDGFVKALPRGLDTALGEDGINVSGGQRRRLALARAFLQRRPILLLDEPLANIDTESATVVLDAILQLRRTTTCFAVTHDPLLTTHADRVVRLEGGRLVEVTNRVPTAPVTPARPVGAMLMSASLTRVH